MLTIIDRYILRSLLVNYLISLGVMISLYIVLDMFVNMDEFTEQGYSVSTVLINMVDYYAPNTLLYYAQLSGTITVFACLAVLARMHRQNEVIAVLASGVSLYRLAAPIIAFGIAGTVLLVIDTEWLIPRVAHKLSRDHDDVDGHRAYEVLFLNDRDGALLSAAQFHPTERDLRRLLVIRRGADGTVVETLEADRAVWQPPDTTRPIGRWQLERARQTTRVAALAPGLGPREDKTVRYPRYYESDLSPEAIEMRQSEGWIGYLSLGSLRELAEGDSPDLAAILRTRHARITAPIVSIILLLLGLPFFLTRSGDNILGCSTKCMSLCGLCYVSTFIAQSIRPETESALPAWIPIFFFGTLAIVLLDRIRT